jgi:hypothetical protein
MSSIDLSNSASWAARLLAEGPVSTRRQETETTIRDLDTFVINQHS